MLYVIGDAIDRGPDGIKILEYIKKHENMDLILGNHEFLMLNSVPIDGDCAFGKNSGINCGAIFLRLDDLKEFPAPIV